MTIRLAKRRSTMPRPLCDLCWAREMTDDDPTGYFREHGAPGPITGIGWLNGKEFEEAFGLYPDHMNALKEFLSR